VLPLVRVGGDFDKQHKSNEQACDDVTFVNFIFASSPLKHPVMRTADELLWRSPVSSGLFNSSATEVFSCGKGDPAPGPLLWPHGAGVHPEEEGDRTHSGWKSDLENELHDSEGWE
jgi:hypothetical protein